MFPFHLVPLVSSTSPDGGKSPYALLFDKLSRVAYILHEGAYLYRLDIGTIRCSGCFCNYDFAGGLL